MHPPARTHTHTLIRIIYINNKSIATFREHYHLQRTAARRVRRRQRGQSYSDDERRTASIPAAAAADRLVNGRGGREINNNVLRRRRRSLTISHCPAVHAQRTMIQRRRCGMGMPSTRRRDC